MKIKIFFITMLCLFCFKSKAQTVLDIDGNTYNTVTIGTQVWMQENLRTTRFNNGVVIPTTSLPINNNTTVLYQWSYDENAANSDVYGLLYTWNVVNSQENVCPIGWHVPDNAEWETLRDFLGGESVAGGKMKETGTTHWVATDSAVDNSSGFTGLGCGRRGNPSGFSLLGESVFFWSSTPFGIIGTFPRGYFFSLNANHNSLLNAVSVANNGNSIRCLKDEPTTSVDDSPLENEMQIFPVPATDRITISFKEEGSYYLVIYDNLGREIQGQELVGRTNYMDISFLPKGIYLIQIIAGDRIWSRQIIKQ